MDMPADAPHANTPRPTPRYIAMSETATPILRLMRPPSFIEFNGSASRLALGFPAEDNDVVFSDINARRIGDIVNDTWSDCLNEDVDRLIPLIAPPPSPLYNPAPPGGVSGVRVVFVWATLRRSDRVRFSSHYAIGFHVKAPHHHAAAHLAYVLGRFSINVYSDYVQHNTDESVSAPLLKRLSYLLYDGGALGVMLYNRGLDVSYGDARVASENDPENCYSEEFHIPITTWPAADPTMRDAGAVHSAMAAARMLVRT
ncbi:hypothetical protein B0H21DRAFT_713494 [Amylocystis lapponica]|nr:hypothetical protein B0H21DRAFT_713494 [Amylocystis lapponica]